MMVGVGVKDCESEAKVLDECESLIAVFYGVQPSTPSFRETALSTSQLSSRHNLDPDSYTND